MKKTFWLQKLPLVLIGSGLVLTVAFAQTNSAKSGADNRVDSPPVKHKKIRDLDEALIELDRGSDEVEKAMREIDLTKIEKEVREAMKAASADMAKASEEMKKALKDLDMTKVQADVQNALKEIDVEKLKKEVQQAFASVDIQKAQAEAQKALKELNVEKMKVQIEQSLKNIDLQKLNLEIEKLQNIDLSEMKIEIEKSMADVKKGIEKAKVEINSFKTLIDDLDRDGFLKKSEGYTISYKNESLTVNGKTLSADEVKKYSASLQGKKDFTIKNTEDDLNIRN